MRVLRARPRGRACPGAAEGAVGGERLGARGEVLRVGQVLVRGAVAVVGWGIRWQGVPRRVVARHCSGLPLTSIAGAAAAGEELLGAPQVALDDEPGAALGREGEVGADVVEERPGRPGEVVAVGDEPLDRRLAGAQDVLVGGRGRGHDDRRGSSR